MATTVGSVAPFDSELQSWEEYCEILDYFLVANDIKEEEKKRAVLLSCVGAQTYALIRNLLSPVKPGDRSYAELVGLLNNHFHPKPSEIVQRWKFNTRNRRPEESVGDYVAELRKLAQDCNFGDSLTVMLRDRLVCGISDDRIQRRLLAEDSLTFEKALKFARAIEAANRDIVDLKSMTEQSRFAKGLGAVNKMEDSGSTSQQVVRKCYRCGGLNHVAGDCRFVSETCHNCGKVGHIKRVCRMKMEQKGGRGRQGKQAHFLEVEQELERLLKEEIIQPVKFSEWAAPIVAILKPDSSARICGDYKLTVNKVSPVEQYPIPRMEDMIAGLAGGEKYTKLDMSHAYQQVVLDDESRKYVTVNTHRGLFTYTRLPFGVSSSPAIFQRTMESVLQGLTDVAVYLDDIILTGKNDKGHLQTLDGVLQRLEEAGLRLKRSKCQFMEKEVTFLGHRVDKTGLHPVPAKVKAVQEAPSPKSVTELKAYLGLLNFYNKFLPRLSTLLAPLHKLLRKGEPWCWGPAQEKVFCKSEELLQSSSVLVHYDEQKDLILSCDASPYGVGAVLAHRMPGGQEKPIGFASRTLNAAEKNYSQLDKEGLAVIFGVRYFHKYLYGRKFMIITDHKPLISLFHELKAVPQMASQRIMRWAVLLRAYEYVIKYREGKNNSNADGLSRLPLPRKLAKEVAAEDQVLIVFCADM
uniref:ribonuclease H n=1 Tax=Paramormyrops kingsleyae TaxID=1676925 RepID=A0A3B3T0U0_9TELE